MPLPGEVVGSHPRLLQSASPTPKPWAKGCKTFHREQLSVFLLKIAEYVAIAIFALLYYLVTQISAM